jgi:hypothetical protein
MMQLPRPSPQAFPLFAATLLAAGLVLAPHSLAAQTPTRTALAVSAQDGKTLLKAEVTDTLGNPVQGGVVSFQIGTESLGTAPVDSSGTAQLEVQTLPSPSSTVQLVAVFSPLAADDDTAPAAAPSASAPAEVHANASGVPDYSITAAPATLSVTAGGFASTQVTITPLNGYVAQVTLSCQALPAFSTCTFSPVINSTAKGPFISSLQIQTQGPSGTASLHGNPLWPAGTVALGAMLPFSLLGLSSLRRRRRALTWFALGFTAVGLVSLSGCSSRYGYNHHPPIQPGGTPLGLANVTVQASGNTGSAVITHSVTVALTVQ